MMVGRRDGMRPISTYTITINHLSIIVKLRVDDILINTYKSCTITHNITYFILMKTISSIMISTRYMQQYTMVTWVMGGRVDDTGYISTYQITNNSLSNVSRGKVDGLFRSISTSSIINYYITPQFTIIKTYILTPTTIITTDITLSIYMTNISTSLVFMDIFIYRTRSK